jgi:ATP-dependent Clp protease adaptor protein ClpS
MQIFFNKFFLSCISSQNKEKWQEDTDVLVEEDVYSGCYLVVYNDEVNSFEYVTITLIEVCEHSQEQAEQCTLQIHFRGKCVVKNGEFDELVKMRNEIVEIYASGFHYSSPRVEVARKGDKTTSIKFKSTGYSDNWQELSTAKKSTITCVKGKIKKQVTAVKPVCPTGFKKASKP